MRKNKLYTYIFLIFIICILSSIFAFAKFFPTSGVGDIPYTRSRGINQNVSTNDTISLIVQNKTYTIQIKDGSTVYDAMNIAQNMTDNNFSFKAKEYPNLGIFIEEINGIGGRSGKYWIYYVNNKEASVGVSKYIIKSGDIITFQQE
jgi:hypothetical protein